MKPEVKKLWVEALLEPDRPQTHGTLERRTAASYDEGGYQPGQCCLGVLCELAVRAGAIAPPKRTSAKTKQGLDLGELVHEGDVDNPEDFVWTGEMGYLEPDGSLITAFLPQQVMDWAGLGEANPEVFWPETDDGDGGFTANLAEMNDTYGCLFKEIAHAIESSDL